MRHLLVIGINKIYLDRWNKFQFLFLKMQILKITLFKGFNQLNKCRRYFNVL